jgi:uncharacterized RmlC-like cupin family protein
MHGDAGRRLHHVRAGELDTGTAQTGGMRRAAAISGAGTGSTALWMGETRIAPATVSGCHHHGHSETGIYVVSGTPVFVFADGDSEVRLETGPGDWVYVPPFVPHREENPSGDQEALVVIARTTQEAVVVNLPGLRPGRQRGDELGGGGRAFLLWLPRVRRPGPLSDQGRRRHRREFAGFKASASLRMADVALSLTLGPSTARLDSSTATSGRANTMGITAPVGMRLTPPPRPWRASSGTH